VRENKMAKKKLSTPDWITEGYDSPAEYAKVHGKVGENKKAGKTFGVRKCPECGSDEVKVITGEIGMWKCKKCRWEGKNIKQEELTEEKFMKYLDDKGEEVS
jgi:ribosomal protein L37AE/L43A